MAANPMYQFNVYRIGPEIKLGSVDISFTNASLFMVISSLACLLYTSDAADDSLRVDLGGRRIIKKKIAF